VRGLACHRVLDKLELVALFLEAECLDRQKLVRVEHRELLLIIHVSTRKVDRGEIGGKSLVFLILGGTYLLGGLAQQLVVAHGQ